MKNYVNYYFLINKEEIICRYGDKCRYKDRGCRYSHELVDEFAISNIKKDIKRVGIDIGGVIMKNAKKNGGDGEVNYIL